MKNYITNFEGPKNKWNNGFIQWFSLSFETGFKDKALTLLSCHFWLAGFQIFEFSLEKK